VAKGYRYMMGHPVSAETRAKLSAALSGRTLSAETRVKIGLANRNRPPMSAETRAKISAIHSGRTFSAEHRARLRAAGLGHFVSEDTRAKIGAANRGRRFSAEHLAKLRDAGLGRHPSVETIAKRATSRKGYRHSAETRNKLRDAWTRRGPISENTRAKLRAVAKKGDQNPNWKGGVVARTGYEAILVNPGCYLPIHRMVMTKAIGRKLKKGEVVHHINGIKTDNRKENLALCSNPAAHKWCEAEEARVFLGQ